MLFCFGLFALLLYNTVVANAVCSYTYSKKDQIHALSSEYQSKGFERKCEYVITAPNSYIIQLNFTDLIGFRTFQSSKSLSTTKEEFARPDSSSPKDKNCLPPELIIKERTLAGRELKTRTICNYNYKIPQVFQYKSNFVKIIFLWVKNARSGFKLDIDFQKSNECEVFCDESNCLDSLVCQTSAPSSNDVQSLGASSSTPISKIVVIIVIVVLMPVLAVFICVVCPCRSTARMLRRWRSRDRGAVEHRQLRPSSQGSEVVYVPSTSSTASTNQENLEHQTALLRERNTMQSAQTSIQFPPHIPISKDGEEGYIQSQNKLDRHRKSNIQNVCFRPPPNKTVYDKDSPPPYSCRSTSSLDSIGQAKSSNLDINGCPVVRCYSMSDNNNHSCFQQQRPLPRTSMSCKQIRQTNRVNMDRPPDYPGVLGTNSSVYHTSAAAPAKNSV